MISIKINDIDFLVKEDISILDACKLVGITVPRFCYHETLSIAGNCRMCLVELENFEKPIASCVTEVEDGMSIWLDTPYVKKARENVIETLLINHPLDCPICDQAGECDLQDQTKNYGGDSSRFFFNKRVVEDKNCGPLIKTIMTRCIHCTRCVRFGTEIAGIPFLGTLGRGTTTEIGGYVSRILNSEISGNIVDLCPVGALTAKPYAFKARSWELRVGESTDTTDSTGASVYINYIGSEILRVLPKFNQKINQNIISDKARFACDANKENRLETVNYRSNNEIDKIDWNRLLQLTDNLFSTNNKSAGSKAIQVVVDEEVDFETLILLKRIANAYKTTFNIKAIRNSAVATSNLYHYRLNAIISDVDIVDSTCFLFSANTRLESAIINARIRSKYRNNYVNIISAGPVFLGSTPTLFVNINLLKIVPFIEGKDAFLSKALIKAKVPLIILGTSLSKRFPTLSSIHERISCLTPRSKIITLHAFCNSSSFSMLNITRVTTRSHKKAEVFFTFNLDDTIFARKDFVKDQTLRPTFWFNTHKSELGFKASVMVPLLSFYESENIICNLEDRPQKTQRFLTKKTEARTLRNLLVNLDKAGRLKTPEEYSAYSFLLEIIAAPALFDNFVSIFEKVKSLSNVDQKEKLNNYPLKPILSDFYRSNRIVKNSKIMNLCSQEVRKVTSNFFIV
jgi:NADH-quinone oxidoreductase subunit G